MKPTEEQILRVIAAYQNNVAGIEDAMHEAIQKWESIRPADEPDRWIPLSERRPTAEDADENSWLLMLFGDRTLGAFRWNSEPIGATHWKRTNLPPKELTAEEIEAKEIRAAYEADDVAYPFDSFKAGWLAHKSKTAKLDIHQTTP